MNSAASAITRASAREMRLYGVGMAAILSGLFVFNAFTIQPLLTPAALLAYALLSLVLAAGYILVTEMQLARKFWPHGWIGWFIIAEIAELAIIFAIALILRGRAELYFYLAVIDDYSGLVLFIGKRRWAVVWVIGLMAVAGLSYAMVWGWRAAGPALLGDLPWFGVAAAFTEFAVRQWEQREQTETLAAELAQAHRQLRDYTAQAEELAITRERARLAHEIHDTVGHTLTALDVQLELLARLPPGRTGQRRQAAEQARSLVKTGLADVRRAVQALRPAALETFSLPEAIASLVADFQRTTQTHTTWQVEGEITPLPPRLALPLYRAAQEALTNVQRHAPAAQQVTIRLHYGSEVVTLSVENDGVRPPSVPPDPSALLRTGSGGEVEGYGLRGLRERAEALGGEFRAGPDEAGGFRLEMSLPLPNPQSDP